MSRHPALTILMVLVGVILLLPGVCALAFTGAALFEGEPSLIILWIVCLLIAAGGLWLIVKGFSLTPISRCSSGLPAYIAAQQSPASAGGPTGFP